VRFVDNVEKYGTVGQATDDNIMWRMRFACRTTKATNTHSEYVVLIAFALQQWSQKRASMLRYMYTACLVYYYQKTLLQFHEIKFSLPVFTRWTVFSPVIA